MTRQRADVHLVRRRPAARTAVRWAAWLVTLGVATAGMYFVRGALDKAHITLVFLLIVLGASAAGGRGLGLTIAGVAFLLFDYVFLPPYATLIIGNPLDWLVLGAFLITSAVATQLLYRATATADAANQRAIEVDRLAALGAETLNAADAGEALRAIAGVIRQSVDVDECDIYLRGADDRVTPVAHARMPATGDAASPPTRALEAGSLVDWIIEHGTSAVELDDGTVRLAHEVPSRDGMAGGRDELNIADPARALRLVIAPNDASLAARVRTLLRGPRDNPTDPRASPAVRALAFPLQVRDYTVGVLRIASRDGLKLAPPQARLLTALAYYAALGAERARLVATAEHAEAERRVEALRSALLTAVSHDLRTPLTTIKGIANEIVRGADPSGASIIESEADRLDALVGDLLDLSRIHAGAVRPLLAVNTADDLIGAALRRVSGAFRGRRIDVDLPHDALLAGVFDFTQTLRILVNLLENALKYSLPSTTVDLRAREASGRLTIDVMDRGPGIADSEHERIFEPFYRPPGVAPDIRGTGLGLSIARGLAEAQQGTLRLVPRTGGGSVFTLDLPSAAAPPPESAFSPAQATA